ncbi:hypothetical protein [Bradyrhizobium sp. JYMT SZCCT0180]|nr:hypothetical protein [Bradyrhizobium sp. JYMT SZCCT0180]
MTASSLTMNASGEEAGIEDRIDATLIRHALGERRAGIRAQ